jgi:hypothetical protein
LDGLTRAAALVTGCPFALVSLLDAGRQWDEHLQPGSTYGVRLMSLHTARRLLIASIEDEKRMGRPTGHLEDELVNKERQTRTFRAYLLAHL